MRGRRKGVRRTGRALRTLRAGGTRRTGRASRTGGAGRAGRSGGALLVPVERRLAALAARTGLVVDDPKCPGTVVPAAVTAANLRFLESISTRSLPLLNRCYPLLPVGE